MPYATIAELPPAVRRKLSPKRQRQFKEVFNAVYARHGDESRAFASAWAAAQKIDDTESDSTFSKQEPYMTGFALFAQLQKVDAAERIVTGIAANEAPDKAGERFHYDSSAPEFKKWSAEIQKGSGGKSLGNVRIMHQPMVAGILTAIDCDDATKAIVVSAKIVSDEAWKMVEAGAYTGFSIGGRYAKRWTDPQEPATKWYTAIPSEISIVDNPCNPDAHFEMIKADGVVELRPLGKAAVDTEVDTEAEPEAAPAPEAAEPAAKAAAPHTADGVRQRWLAADGAEFVTKAEAIRHNEELAAAAAAQETARPAMDAAARLEAALALAKGGDAPGDGSKPYGNVAYADPGLRGGKKRYPIDTEEHIRAAWNYIHKPANAGKYSAEQAASIKRKIAAAWRSKIDPKGPPEAAEKAADETPDLLKSLWEVGRVACIIQELRCVKDDLAREAAMENEAPTCADAAQTLIDGLCEFLVKLVAEETSEIRSGEEVAAELALAILPEAEDIAKDLAAALPEPTDETGALVGWLEKLGAKHSREDQARLDLAHHALSMAQGLGGLSKADSGHIERALGALRSAGAAPGPHYRPGHNSTVNTAGAGSIPVPQGHAAPGPHYRSGENSTVDTGHPATPVPQGPTRAGGRAKNIAMAKALDDLFDALVKRHGGHTALLTAAHDLVAKVAGEGVCEAMKAGARHSAETMAHLAEAHDGIVKAGGLCKASGLGALPPNTAPNEGEEEHEVAADTQKVDTGDLTKRDSEFAALKAAVGELAGQMEKAAEAIGELVAQRDELRERLEKVEAEPLPAKTIARPGVLPPGLFAAEKSAAEFVPDEEQIAKAFESMTEDERQLAVIKAAIRLQNFTR
jgi:cation transport regulator ChaB